MSSTDDGFYLIFIIGGFAIGLILGKLFFPWMSGISDLNKNINAVNTKLNRIIELMEKQQKENNNL